MSLLNPVKHDAPGWVIPYDPNRVEPAAPKKKRKRNKRKAQTGPLPSRLPAAQPETPPGKVYHVRVDYED